MSKYSNIRSNSVSKRPPPNLNRSLDTGTRRGREGSLDRSYQHARETSIDRPSLSILSHKVPINFTPTGIDIQRMPHTSLEHETKLTLYSEVERLSVLNYELKKQNELLAHDNEHLRYLSVRVPDVERELIEMEKELARKDGIISNNLVEMDRLRSDNINLAKLEPAYAELLNHNRSLLEEIDKVNMITRDQQLERERILNELSKAKNYEMKYSEAERMNDDLRLVKTNLESQAEDLRQKIQELYYDNDKTHKACNEFSKELDYMRMKYEEAERVHIEQVSDLKNLLEYEKKVALEQERADLNSKFYVEKTKLEQQQTLERGRLENQLALCNKNIEELQNKVSLFITENENLQQMNLEKVSEIDNLRLKNYQLETKIEEVKEQKDEERRGAIETQSKDLNNQFMEVRRQYEERIYNLTSEIAKLEKIKGDREKDIRDRDKEIREKEKDLENLRIQNQYNEKLWERKMSQTVENEIKQQGARHSMEKNELENEIHSLRARILELENQLSVMTMEVERLAGLHEDKHTENEELRAHIQNIQTTHRASVEDLKTKAEHEKKRELEQLQYDLNRIHENQMSSLREKIGELENKIVTLVNDNLKLSNLSDERARDCETMKARYQQLEDKYNYHLNELEKKHDLNLRSTLEKEVNSLIVKNNMEVALLENKIFELNQQISNLDAKVHYYEGEHERLIAQINRKAEELNDEKKRFLALENQRSQDIQALRSQFESYKNANIDSKAIQTRYEIERQTLISQINHQKETIDELEQRLTGMIAEYEKLKAYHNERMAEIDVLKKRLNDSDYRLEQEKVLHEKQLELMKHSAYDAQEMTIRYNSEKAQYENQIRQLKTLNENGKLELEKLYDLMNTRKREYESYAKQNEELKKQVERLTAQLRQFDQESSSKKERFDGVLRTLEEIEHERDIYKSKVDKLNSELSRANLELNAKIRELDYLKQKYEKSMEISSQLNSQLMNKLIGHEQNPFPSTSLHS